MPVSIGFCASTSSTSSTSRGIYIYRMNSYESFKGMYDSYIEVLKPHYVGSYRDWTKRNEPDRWKQIMEIELNISSDLEAVKNGEVVSIAAFKSKLEDWLRRTLTVLEFARQDQEKKRKPALENIFEKEFPKVKEEDL